MNDSKQLLKKPIALPLTGITALALILMSSTAYTQQPDVGSAVNNAPPIEGAIEAGASDPGDVKNGTLSSNPRAGDQASTDLNTQFKNIDKNASGGIDAKEFEEGWTLPGEFSDFDADDNKSVSLEEFKAKAGL